MTEETIILIKNKILNLVPNGNGSLLADSCSEVTRLVGHWLKESFPNDILNILKGSPLNFGNKSHDLLTIQSTHSIFILDPTIWQFFPHKKSILIYQGSDLKDGMEIVKELYGGEWEEKEEVGILSPAQEKEYLKIINKNSFT